MTEDEIIQKLAEPAGDPPWVDLSGRPGVKDAVLIPALERAAKAGYGPHLQSVDLGHTKVTDAGVLALAQHCPQLRTLGLERTQLTDAGVLALAQHCPQLLALRLGETRVTDAGVLALAQHCPQLQTLDLWDAKVTDAGVLALAQHCPRLQTLRLDQTRVTDAGVLALAQHCPQLQVLGLGSTQVTDAGVRAVVQYLSRLRFLSLDRTDSLCVPPELINDPRNVAGIRTFYALGETEGRRQLNEAKVIASRASIRQNRGDLASEEEDIRRAIEWGEQQTPRDERGLAIWYASRASIRQNRGDLAGAEEDIRRAIEWGEQQTPRDERGLAIWYASRASIRQNRGDVTEANQPVTSNRSSGGRGAVVVGEPGFTLKLAFSEMGPGKYRSRIEESPLGASVGQGCDFELAEQQIRDWLLTPNFAAARRSNLVKLGQTLFNLALRDEVRDKYEQCVAVARERGAGLRIALSGIPGRLIAMPWEYMHDDSSFLLKRGQSVVRVVDELPEKMGDIGLPIQPIIRPLLAVANPTDQDQFDPQEHLSKLTEALGPDCRPDVLMRAEAGTIREAMLRNKYDCFYFAGHGRFTEALQGQLIVEGPNGESQYLDAARLAEWTREGEVRFAYLNACSGQQTGLGNPFAAIAQRLMRDGGLRSVVAMQTPIAGRSALKTAEEFFIELQKGRKPESALERSWVVSEDFLSCGPALMYTHIRGEEAAPLSRPAGGSLITGHGSAKALWTEKLMFLSMQDLIATNPEAKAALRFQIEECNRMIRLLDDSDRGTFYLNAWFPDYPPEPSDGRVHLPLGKPAKLLVNIGPPLMVGSAASDMIPAEAADILYGSDHVDILIFCHGARISPLRQPLSLPPSPRQQAQFQVVPLGQPGERILTVCMSVRNEPLYETSFSFNATEALSEIAMAGNAKTLG